MSVSTSELITLLEDKACALQKTQTNLRKCPKQRLTQGYIKARLKTIEEDWQAFRTYHETVLKVTPKDERMKLPYFHNEDYYLVEDLYHCLVGNLKDMQKPFIQTSQELTENPVMAPQVKLPSIHLPTFSGQYEEWQTFKDLFTSLVHNNLSLSRVQKLQYLKSSVVGEAEALLKHINITDANYDQAWDLLKTRYGNKRIIVNSILKRLFGQRKIASATANHLKNLVDTTTECLNNLENLQVSTASWDQVIIYVVTNRLDLDTHKAWEDHAFNPDADKLPTWHDLKNFLEAKYRTLELINPTLLTIGTRHVKERTFHVATSTPPTSKICILCNENHSICHCNKFMKLNTKERSELAKQNNLCYNCLVPGHSARRCRLRLSCRICRRRHHTMLHQNNQSSPTEETQEQKRVILTSHLATKQTTALLATALILVKNKTGKSSILRALIDQGSQASFVTERAAQLLGIKRTKLRGTISGVGTTKTEVNQVVQLQLRSRYDDTFLLPVKAYVMPTRLTSQLPSKSIVNQKVAWQHLENLPLADPSFNRPGRIDLLLGVEGYAQIIRNNLIRGPPGTPCAQDTSFGWIIFGEVQSHIAGEEIMVMHHEIKLDDLLYKLWEIDTTDNKKETEEEETCQRMYKETYTRNEEGRYIVKLPLKNEPPKVINGNTRNIPRNRILQLEKRLERNKDIKEEYCKVMQEYLTLNHLEEVPENEVSNPAVYLPHHHVIKETSETTRCRVVFNASSPGTNNTTLNDDHIVGPQLQEDMRSLLMRFRLKRIGYVADIQKMYRQIRVTERDTNYQRILWCSDTNTEIKDYRLLTVTFGTASAPYLAVRTLQQIAEDEGYIHPEAAETILADFFMDDLMSGQDTSQEAKEVAQNIAAILKKGGFILQKWSSNSAEFLKEFNTDEISSKVKVDFNVGGTVRTLGISWNLEEDKLTYSCHLPTPSNLVTKRNILGEMQHLFDPLGWLCPAILPAKLLLQKLWLIGVSWDEILQNEIKEEWLHIRNSWDKLNRAQVERWLHTTRDNLPEVTVHGFCDASEKAYGAVAYLRVKASNGDYKVGLIAARARVAPIKPVSLPRLELCGAVLLSKLLNQISKAMRVPKTQIFAWTDSTIVLSWLRGDPARWQTFVRNRVVTILDNIGHKWYHVQTNDNPADIASRGMLLPELMKCDLWWQGPQWIKDEEIKLHEVTDLKEPERKRPEREERINVYMNVNTNENESVILTQMEDFNDLMELMNTIVYCKRFLNYKRQRDTPNTCITPEELNVALEHCVRLVRNKEFSTEINLLKNNKYLDNKNQLKKLNPFLDQKNVLRVGGRLRHAHIPEDTKYPIILNKESSLATLIILDSNKKTLHGRVQLTMNYVRSRFWIPGVKSLVKSTIYKCFICARQRAITRTQLMGDLPEARVNPARPFFNSGVDFAGPLQILRSKGRGSKCEKGYICIFVCMATKGLHLELVGDLTTESFLGAMKRFVSRRGRCGHIWSDRGTNFVGASTELQGLWTKAKLEIPKPLINLLAEDGTQWHFNPPYSPHHGGLWEAGVKSIKHHLKRILTKNLTFEEMSTTLCQIEACLNSRPLCAIDGSDIDSLEIITPGHFLIGETPINIPQPNLQDVNWNYLSRWQHTQRLTQHFWRKWQTEYLTRLQQVVRT